MKEGRVKKVHLQDMDYIYTFSPEQINTKRYALVAVHGSHICALPFIFEVPLCAFGVLLVYLCFSLVWLTINLGSIKLFQSLVWNKHQMFEMKRTPAAYFKWLLFSFVIMSVEEYAVLWLLLQIIYGNYLKIFLV